MSILIGLAPEPVFNAAMATQVVFQQPDRPQAVAMNQYFTRAGVLHQPDKGMLCQPAKWPFCHLKTGVQVQLYSDAGMGQIP